MQLNCKQKKFSSGAGFLIALALAGAAVGLSGCGVGDIEPYRVPKERPETPRAAAAQQEGMPFDMGRMPHAHWTAPEGWEERPPAGLRLVTFVVRGAEERQAEVSIIPLPGMTGIELEIESVNIWLEELGLEKVDRDGFNRIQEKVTAGDAQGRLFDLVSTESRLQGKFRSRTVGAIVPRRQTTWFIKMTGEDQLVAEQKETFKQFLETLEFHEPGEHGGQELARQPVDSYALPASGKPYWRVPEGWREVAPTSMRVASFAIPGRDREAADLSVSKFPGEAGGILPNINRWRGEIGLGPLTPADLDDATTTVELASGRATVMDMAGEGNRAGTRILAAIVPRPAETWFYKMTGEDDLVAEQRNAFIQFLQSARYDQ